MWTALGIGGGLGALGVIAALWFRYKLAVVKGENIGLTKDAESLKKDLRFAMDRIDEGMKREARLILDHQDGLKRRDAELQVHIQREEELRELLRTCNDPAVVADRLGRLFPAVPKSHSNR